MSQPHNVFMGNNVQSVSPRERIAHVEALKKLTHNWGTHQDVSLYLDRCQVDTEPVLVQRVWKEVRKRRQSINKVVDFGAGDGRFSRIGEYKCYVGFEIDGARFHAADLPELAEMRQECAFSNHIEDADLAIGNPPYVRNQDLPVGWREHAARVVAERTSVSPSGLANAWQYFFLLSLASTQASGLVALVIPYEWVSRPSSRALRQYIVEKGWGVSVYRLHDSAFSRVLTTSSITIVDKRETAGVWLYFEEQEDGTFRKLPSPTGHADGVMPYLKSSGLKSGMRAKRGLSPGTQKVLTLTESERARLGLSVGTDVVECVTTLRHFPESTEVLNADSFREHFRDAGGKCWLIRTDSEPSKALRKYLDSIPPSMRDTATCEIRDTWWAFTMPEIPGVLVSSGFRGDYTKAVVNTVGARAVGGVCGIYGVKRPNRAVIATQLRELSLTSRIVAHSNGLKKLEINQLNAILDALEVKTSGK